MTFFELVFALLGLALNVALGIRVWQAVYRTLIKPQKFDSKMESLGFYSLGIFAYIAMAVLIFSPFWGIMYGLVGAVFLLILRFALKRKDYK